MAVNKVIYYGEVLVDMSQVTVKPETLGKGETALDASGELIVGTAEVGEPTLQSKTVSPSTSAQTVKPDSGYDGLSQVTVNAMTTATQATPSISVDSAGKITASATQTAGYVAAGTKSATKQLTAQAAQTITPGTADKTIASGQYLTGTQTIKGDANLVAGNIKSGVSIFGVAGSYEGSGGSSGGAVETCTVVLDTSTSSYRPYYYSYTKVNDDGSITGVAVGPNSTLKITLTNVVCGSVVTVYWYGGTGLTVTNAQKLGPSSSKYFNAYLITAPAGGTATINNASSGSGGST